MEKNKSIYFLLALSVILITLGRLYVPWLLFLGIAPLLAILTTEHKFKYKGFDFLVLASLVICHVAWALIADQRFFITVVYAVLIWTSTVIFLFTNKHARNKLGLLTLVIFWMAMEYLALKIDPEFAYTLLGSSVTNPSLTPWSSYSGMTGVSCWILIANILLYIVFFKNGGILEGKIRWVTLTYSLVLIALPLILALLIDFPQASHISSETVYNLYDENNVSIEPYNQNAEVFGRTSAWVSVLIIIYAFVKREIK